MIKAVTTQPNPRAGSSSRSLTCAAQAQVLGLWLAAFLRILAGSWMRSREAGTQKTTALTEDASVTGVPGSMYFSFLALVYLYERQNIREREGQTERSSTCWFTPPKRQNSQSWIELKQGTTNSSPGTQVRGRNTSIWGTLCCFPRSINTKLDLQQSSQDTDSIWPLHSTLALQMAA